MSEFSARKRTSRTSLPASMEALVDAFAPERDIPNDADLSPTERENLELVLAFKKVPASERGPFLAPDVKWHRYGVEHIPELVGKPGLTLDHSALADRTDDMHEIAAMGDRVIAVWSLRARHVGLLYDTFPGDGRPIDIIEVGIWRIENGLIAEGWFIADEIGLLRQLGVELALVPPTKS